MVLKICYLLWLKCNVKNELHKEISNDFRTLVYKKN